MAGPLAKFRKSEAEPPKVEKMKSRKPAPEKKPKGPPQPERQHEPYEYFVFIKSKPNDWVEHCVSIRKFYALKSKKPRCNKLARHGKVTYYFERRLTDGTLVDVPPDPPRPFTEFRKSTSQNQVAKTQKKDDSSTA